MPTTHLPVVRPYAITGFAYEVNGAWVLNGRYSEDLFDADAIAQLIVEMRAQLDRKPKQESTS